MPAWSDHLALASRCRCAHEALAAGHTEWMVAIAFYEALHLVEAVAASDTQCAPERAVTHQERRDLLYKHARFAPIRQPYKELHRASLIARYMDGGPHAAERFFRMPNVRQLVIVQWLGRVRAWAAGELKTPHLASPSPALPPSAPTPTPAGQPPGQASGSAAAPTPPTSQGP